MVFFTLLLFTFLSFNCLNVLPQPIVTVEQGQVQGETIIFKEDEFINVEKEISIFRAIPFAEPPIGELRFKPPITKGHWDGIWNATYDRPVCWQGEDEFTSAFEKNEDCLYLTVYAPNPKVNFDFC